MSSPKLCPWLPLPGDLAVRMREVLARPWVGVCLCHMLLSLSKLKDVTTLSIFSQPYENDTNV